MIRRYQEADAARCCEIINACLPQLTDMNEAARDYVRAKNIPAILHPELDSLFTVVYAEDDTALGLGALAETKIKRVYVAPTRQSEGIGHAIVAALENEAIRQRLTDVVVRSRPDAVPFYISLGYRVICSETHVIAGSQFSIVNMEKALHVDPAQ